MTVAAIRPMGPLEWAMLLTLALLWGGSFYFSAVALRDLPPMTVVLGRVASGALLLHLMLLLSNRRMPPDLRSWGRFLAMGMLNNAVPFTLIVWGQTHIASGMAAILNATTPLFTVLVAHWATRDERLSGGRVAGVLAGMAGVAVMIGPSAAAGLDAAVLGALAVLGAAISYALAGVYGRRFAGEDPMVTATGQVTASSALMLPLVLLAERPWALPVPGWPALAAVLALGLVCTSLAYILYFRILATAGATNLLLVTFLVPVGALALGVGVLGEPLLPGHLAGMALIWAGLALVDGRALRKARAARPRWRGRGGPARSA